MTKMYRYIWIFESWLLGLVLMMCPLSGLSSEAKSVVYAHRPYVMQRTVTNHTIAARKVVKVATSCACLKAEAIGQTEENLVPPGGVLPFELTLNPAGMEGLITKAASVTFDDGSVETMVVEANVRTRLKLSPSDAAFGVIAPKDMGRVLMAKLKGEIADRVKIVGLKGPECPFFDVVVSEDGKGVVVRFRSDDRNRSLAGGHVETWIVQTDDEEIPAIAFSVSATIAGEIAVSPQVLTTAVEEDMCSRMVTLRGKKAFTVLSARTMPRGWGEVTVARRPLNGWMITITGIDPNELRQFSKRPYLEVRTDCPEMETFEIPMRVAQEGSK